MKLIKFFSCVISVVFIASFASAKITAIVPNGGEGDGLRAAAKDYTALTGIEVELVQAPYEQVFDKAANAANAKSGAYDIILMDDPWIPFFAENGHLAELGPFFDALGVDGPDSDFLGKSIALCRDPYNSGPYICIPYVGNAQMFFYDSGAFADAGLVGPPSSWDEVHAAMQKISSSGSFGYVLRAQEGNPVVAQYMPIFWSFCGKLFDENRNATVNSPEGQKALEFFLKLRDVSPPGAASMNQEETGQYLLQGMAKSSINWPNWVSNFEDPSQSNVVGKMSYAAIPSGDCAGSSEIGHWTLGITSASKNKQAAFDFVNWATSKEQIDISAGRGNPPVRFSTFINPELTSQDRLRHFPVLMEAINYSTPRPRHPKWPELEQVFGVYLSKAVAGVMSPGEALDQANAELDKILK
jgi:multiple sugar transport system substrate-binding protein